MEDILLQHILDNDLMIIKNIKGKLSKLGKTDNHEKIELELLWIMNKMNLKMYCENNTITKLSLNH